MSASDLLPLVIGLFGVLVTAVIAVLGGGYWLRGKFAGVEQKFGDVERSLERVQTSISAMGRSVSVQIQLAGTIIGALRRQGTLGDADLTEIERLFVLANVAAIRQTVETEEQRHNPLSHDELERLKFYIDKAERGDLFNYDEIQEYRGLVAKLEEDKGRVDPGVVALVGLGALLLGIWLGSRSR